MIGASAIKVYSLLIEFIKADVGPLLEDGQKPVYSDELFDKFTLARIADDFLVGKQNDPIKIFDAINDAYSTKYGIENFIDYQKVLAEDKKRGFTGLASIFEKRKKFYNKKSSVN